MILKGFDRICENMHDLYIAASKLAVSFDTLLGIVVYMMHIESSSLGQVEW